MKESFPEIQVIASGFFDDSDVKLCATRYVDHLTSLKLCNGYAFVDFQMAYVKDKLVENAEPTNFVVLLGENELPCKSLHYLFWTTYTKIWGEPMKTDLHK